MSIIHDTGVFYYCLGNLNASLRSSLNSIQLLAVVKTQFITEYGIDTILQPFMEDLKLLERVYKALNYVSVYTV